MVLKGEIVRSRRLEIGGLEGTGGCGRLGDYVDDRGFGGPVEGRGFMGPVEGRGFGGPVEGRGFMGPVEWGVLSGVEACPWLCRPVECCSL